MCENCGLALAIPQVRAHSPFWRELKMTVFFIYCVSSLLDSSFFDFIFPGNRWLLNLRSEKRAYVFNGFRANSDNPGEIGAFGVRWGNVRRFLLGGGGGHAWQWAVAEGIKRPPEVIFQDSLFLRTPSIFPHRHSPFAVPLRRSLSGPWRRLSGFRWAIFSV